MTLNEFVLFCICMIQIAWSQLLGQKLNRVLNILNEQKYNTATPQPKQKES
jgi:hypothetical protein